MPYELTAGVEFVIEVELTESFEPICFGAWNAVPYLGLAEMQVIY